MSNISFPTPGSGFYSPNELETLLEALLHGLTQPLTALRGLLEVSLQEELTSAECQKTLRDALGQAERLSDSIVQFKEVVQSGNPGDGAEDLSWAEAVGRAVESLEPLAKARDIAILLNAEERSCVRANGIRLDSCTRACLEMALELSPAASAVRINLQPSGKVMMLAICGEHAAGEPEVEEFIRRGGRLSNRSVPSPMAVRWFILRRMMQAQGGTATLKHSPPRALCLELRLPQRSRGAFP